MNIHAKFLATYVLLPANQKSADLWSRMEHPDCYERIICPIADQRLGVLEHSKGVDVTRNVLCEPSGRNTLDSE